MATSVRIPSPMRQFTAGADQLALEGDSVGAVLDNLLAQAAGLATRLFKPGTKTLNRNVNVYVNDEDIRFLQNLETPLRPGDVISIVPAIAGG